MPRLRLQSQFTVAPSSRCHFTSVFALGFPWRRFLAVPFPFPGDCCLGHRSAVRVRKVPVDLPPVVDIGHAVVTSQAVVGGGGAAFLVAHPSRGEDARTELGICEHDDDYEGCLEKGKRQGDGPG